MKITSELQAEKLLLSRLSRFSAVKGNAYVSMSYRWFNEYKLSFLFGVGAFFVEQLRRAHECAREHSI